MFHRRRKLIAECSASIVVLFPFWDHQGAQMGLSFVTPFFTAHSTDTLVSERGFLHVRKTSSVLKVEMLSQLQASYKNVEASLQRLTDSIAAYNPSVLAAEELLAADDEVNKDLEQRALARIVGLVATRLLTSLVVEHQQNHLRIEELRRLTDANDRAIKKQFQGIIDLRKEMASMRTYESEEVGSDVSVHDLLSYAKFISRTTVPPTMRNGDHPLRLLKKDESQLTNGSAPVSAVPGDTDTVEESKHDRNVGVNAMNESERAWLDPLANLPFEPWPSVDIIQRGALADVQRMIDRGDDPAAVLSPEEQVEADKRKKEEEERERIAQEERERRRMSMFDVGGGSRRRPTAQEDVFDPDA